MILMTDAPLLLLVVEFDISVFELLIFFNFFFVLLVEGGAEVKCESGAGFF